MPSKWNTKDLVQGEEEAKEEGKGGGGVGERELITRLFKTYGEERSSIGQKAEWRDGFK